MKYMSVKEIAAEMGISKPTVVKYLKEHNVDCVDKKYSYTVLERELKKRFYKKLRR